ncbi:suppressor of loss of ypt1 [Mortierella sp. NVP85]|nr:suppressor of loss of ypt1 [Mortierella sp. NVP85]
MATASAVPPFGQSQGYSGVNEGSIPFFDSSNDCSHASAQNPLTVRVQQLPTPRTSFSSGASSPPETLSPGPLPTASSQHQYHFSHLSPSSSAASSPIPAFASPSTIASTPYSNSNHTQNHSQSNNGAHGPVARSPLSVSHLYPSHSASRSSLNSTLSPALSSPSASPLSTSITNNNSTAFVHTAYSNGSNVYSTSGGISSSMGGRLPIQAQQYQLQQEQLYYDDDEKEQQKKNARSTVNSIAGFLPPTLNQGLSRVVQTAQATISSSSKTSLPSSRPFMEGTFSTSQASSGLSVDANATRGMLIKLYTASKLPLICLLWYLSSAVTNNIGKQIMNQFRYPVTLTFIQFVFVSLFCFILGSGFKMATIRKPSMAIMHMTAPLVGFQVVGHVFSSIAISRVPLSFVHTIKALSPLFTVIFYRIMLGTTYSREVYISLVPLTAGVMLACRMSLEFNNLVGLLCALASTLVFVTQNVFTKKILSSSKAKQEKLGGLGNSEATKEDDHAEEAGSSPQKLDKINILFYSSTMAAICMVPIWLYTEGLSLIFPDESGAYHHAMGHSAGFWAVSWLLFLNGISHFFQNVFAFSVLALTSPVTYSIASLIKRIVVIVASIVYFHQTLGTTQWTGVCLTFWGLWLYNSAKNAAKVRPSGGLLSSTIGRRVSRNFGKGLLDTGNSFDRKGSFLA